jgi:hypothetical protein
MNQEWLAVGGLTPKCLVNLSTPRPSIAGAKAGGHRPAMGITPRDKTGNHTQRLEPGPLPGAAWGLGKLPDSTF